MSELEGNKVSLHVYDLSQGLARQLSTKFLGKSIEAVWHTGIVVYGNEYYFGVGIQHSPTGTTPYGGPVKVIDLGITHIPKDGFETYLQEINPKYTKETYSLLSHNCNNFSNEVAQFLVGAEIPDYILNLPKQVMSSPMSLLMMPMIKQLEATLRSGVVPQFPQFKSFTVSSSPLPTATTMVVPEPSDVHTISSEESHSSKTKAHENVSSTNINKSVAAERKLAVRKKVKEEITAEFTTIMATGRLRASEAVALATRRVMQRNDHANLAHG
ncbi:desumoylating isopeptidase 1-like [Impatiens glandulifera]|uniref:desumoylating isopeptidase 1-like n=1 Tax=Impatiens glandulifera TaxID=253017 RepID=UPI001FB135BC|nr:desumoylating isopeptidase 1-like [Impatiens glandulifera]